MEKMFWIACLVLAGVAGAVTMRWMTPPTPLVIDAPPPPRPLDTRYGVPAADHQRTVMGLMQALQRAENACPGD